MRIEQPSELNQYVDKTIPMTWAVRRRFMTLALPFLMISSLMLAEFLAFHLWLQDANLHTRLLRFLVVPVPFIIFLVFVEVSIRVGHKSSRYVDIQRDKIANKRASFKWERVLQCRLAPISGQNGLRKLTFTFNVRGKRTCGWTMVLQHPEQTRALRSEFELLRKGGTKTPPLLENDEPEPPRKPVRIRGPVLVAIALFVFCNGMPVLAASLAGSEPRSNQDSPSTMTTKEKEKMQQFVLSHFASRAEFRRFGKLTGGALTALGAGLYVWGFATMLKDSRT